jgi:hypothetical protein
MKIVLVIFLAAAIQSLTAQQNHMPAFTKNQQVYVYSFTGLNLRDSAYNNANIIRLLHFGDTVQVIETTAITCLPIVVFKKDTAINPDSYSENPVRENLILQGSWVKVKHKNEVGFINGIYLSALPHVKNLEKKWGDKLYEANGQEITALQEQVFLLLNKLYGIPEKSPQLTAKALLYKKVIAKKDYGIQISFSKKYKDGLEYNYADDYVDNGVGGYTITIAKKGMSFSEAIMFSRAFFYTDDALYKREMGFYVEEKKYVITNYGEGGGCTGEVYKNKAGEWVVSYGCVGC